MRTKQRERERETEQCIRVTEYKVWKEGRKDKEKKNNQRKK